MQEILKRNILFVHQNFPGQFRHLASACIAKGHRVIAIGHHSNTCPKGMQYIRYPLKQQHHSSHKDLLQDFESKLIRGQAVRDLARQLREQGFYPDVIVAHPGWGEAMFLKEVWPQARLGLYAEFFYRGQGADVGFDLEFETPGTDHTTRLLLKNTANHLQFPQAEAYLSPTQWQASTYPLEWQSRMSVIHEGIDTESLKPCAPRPLVLGDGTKVEQNEKVITFVARNLEPYRGYHIFMRALASIQALAPDVRVLIVGGEGTSYGRRPPTGVTWKDQFWNEVKDSVAVERVHFLGQLPYEQFIQVLQRSMVHVYLTYPFVLSWSLLEAMSLGKAIVASDTTPVKEVITHGKEGLLVPFFDKEALSQAIVTLLNDPIQRNQLGQTARQKVVAQYDRQRRCLPQQMAWLDTLSALPLRAT